MLHAALGGEELDGIVDAQRRALADALALEQNPQGFGIEASAAAHIAEHLHIRQEAHLDALHPLAFAGLAAAAGRIEREAAGREAADACVGGLGIQPADRVPESDVGGRTGARRLADRRLVDFEHAADRLPAGDRLASSGAGSAPRPCALRPCAARAVRATSRLRLPSSTSRASEDLPEPDTPVITVKRPSGMRASTLRRLCREAPLMSIDGRVAHRCAAGGATSNA